MHVANISNHKQDVVIYHKISFTSEDFKLINLRKEWSRKIRTDWWMGKIPAPAHHINKQTA